MEGLVDKLKEQIAMLSTFLEEEKIRHEKTKEKNELKLEQEIEKMVEDHEKEMKIVERKHDNYIALLKSHHNSILKILERTLQTRIKRLRDECALLQAALRNYKDVVRADYGKIWGERQEMLKLENEEKISNAVRTVKMEMEKRFDIEREELKEKYERLVSEKIEEVIKKMTRKKRPSEVYERVSDLSDLTTAEESEVSEEESATTIRSHGLSETTSSKILLFDGTEDTTEAESAEIVLLTENNIESLPVADNEAPAEDVIIRNKLNETSLSERTDSEVQSTLNTEQDYDLIADETLVIESLSEDEESRPSAGFLSNDS